MEPKILRLVTYLYLGYVSHGHCGHGGGGGRAVRPGGPRQGREDQRGGVCQIYRGRLLMGWMTYCRMKWPNIIVQIAEMGDRTPTCAGHLEHLNCSNFVDGIICKMKTVNLFSR